MESQQKVNTHHTFLPNLTHLLDRYYETEEIAPLVETLYPWIRRFCIRLHTDPDIVGEFFLRFYPRMPHLLALYRERREVPLLRFLARCLRNEFNNFIRSYRRHHLPEKLTPEPAPPGFRYQFHRGEELVRESGFDPLHRIAFHMNRLEESLRIPLKLYYGFELEGSELRHLTGLFPRAEEAALFIEDFERRKEKTRRRLNDLNDRSAYLNQQIHGSHLYEHTQEQVSRYRRWKRRVDRRIHTGHGIYSLQELASLFGVSKSTQARRINLARRTLATLCAAENPSYGNPP